MNMAETGGHLNATPTAATARSHKIWDARRECVGWVSHVYLLGLFCHERHTTCHEGARRNRFLIYIYKYTSSYICACCSIFEGCGNTNNAPFEWPRIRDVTIYLRPIAGVVSVGCLWSSNESIIDK